MASGVLHSPLLPSIGITQVRGSFLAPWSETKQLLPPEAVNQQNLVFVDVNPGEEKASVW